MKNIGLLIAGLFWIQTLSAQFQSTDRRFLGGIVAGLNLSQIDGDAEAGFNKMGLNVGARGGVILSKKWEIAIEMLFSQKGSQSRMIQGVPRNIKCNLNYLEIPLEVCFKDWEISDGDAGKSYMRIMASAGLSYNYLMGGSLFLNPSQETLDRFRKYEVAMRFSASVFFTRNWALNLGWTRSITSITGKDSAGNNWGSAVNRMLLLRAFYMF
jgi:hypothetical protein